MELRAGTSVRLNAVVDPGAGKSFFGWSEPDCGTSSSCTIRVDDQLTSVVALFAPLMLAVKFSDNDGGATVSANPAGQPCDPAEEPGDATFCRAYPPHTRVALTVTAGTTPFRGWNEQGELSLRAHERGHVHDRGRGSADLGRSTVRERAAAAAGDDDQRRVQAAQGRQRQRPRHGVEAGLRHGLHGQLRLRQADHVDREPGRRLALRRLERGLRADPADLQLPGRPDHLDPGCIHQGRDGADDARHAVIGSRTRSSIAISWAGSTDNVRVAGYRVYLNDAPAGETQATAYTLEGLKCGRSYAVAVDAVDGLGNRSQRASVTTQTQPCALAARLAGVGVGRARGARVVIVTVRVNRATTARLRLLRGGRTVCRARFGVAPGANKLRLRVPKKVARGSYRLVTTLVNPDGGTVVLPGRGVLLPRP